MKLTAAKEGTTRYFQAKLGWKEQFDPKEIEMLSVGAVPVLIPPSAILGHKNNVIQYDISPYSTLEFYLTCILSREQFAQLLLQCVSLFRQMQQVYLSYKNLVLELDQIYVLLSDRTLHFIYLPLAGGTREASIPDFFRKMIHGASRSTYEQVSFLDSCLAWLNQPIPFVMNAFEDFVLQNGCAREPAAAMSNAPASVPVSASEVAPAPGASRFYQPTCQEEPDVPAQDVLPRDGETSWLDPSDCGGTVGLADGPEATRPKFYLVREKTGERIEVSRSPFLVGSEAGSMDYCVTGNPAVSRKHAKFFLQDGQCSVSDEKSTNRTYVNNCALEPQVAQILQDGDHVRLANEDFTFVREE